MLTTPTVTSIKQAICAGQKQKAIAHKFGVSRSLVSDIACGRRHADVPWPAEAPHKKAGGRRKVETYDPTDARVLELEAEVVHLTEERNRAKAAAKASAKVAGLFKAIVSEMDKRIVPLKALPRQWTAPKKGVIEEHVVLHLSDAHADQVVRPEEVGGLEAYDFNVACARAERLVETILQWTQTTMGSNFRFSNLWVLANGDHTSGQIHGHEARSFYRNQLRNSFAIGQLFALMLREMAPHFPHVHYVGLSGNHGRWTPKKDHSAPLANWDALVSETAKMLCRDIGNIDFLIPNSYSINLDINGHGFNVSHGDDVKGSLGIPAYGLMRRQKNLMCLSSIRQSMPVRYIAVGHHHIHTTIADLDGEILANGAWPACDAYSYNSFAGYREPSQLLHGVHAKHGVSWRLPVKLKHTAEASGPKRYLIDGGRDDGPLGV